MPKMVVTGRSLTCRSLGESQLSAMKWPKNVKKTSFRNKFMAFFYHFLETVPINDILKFNVLKNKAYVVG